MDRKGLELAAFAIGYIVELYGVFLIWGAAQEGGNILGRPFVVLMTGSVVVAAAYIARGRRKAKESKSEQIWPE